MTFWAETSKRNVSYALCNDRRTLLWFANQRAVEYHPTLVLAVRPDRVTHLVLDLDPPDGDGFARAVRAAHLVRRALTTRARRRREDERGQGGARVRARRRRGVRSRKRPPRRGPSRREPSALDPAIATTAFMKEDRGGKVFVDSTRVGGATVGRGLQPEGAAGRAGVVPGGVGRARRRRASDFTVHTALRRSATATRGRRRMPAPQPLSDELIAEGQAIPVARVQAMHEGKRRARARRAEG